MSFTPCLGFPGTTRAAMTRYGEIFGATDLQFMTFGDAPPGAAPPGNPDGIMHAQFSTGAGAVLMASDVTDAAPKGQTSPAILHTADTIDRAKAIFAALSEGGQVILPIGPTSWSPMFGMLVDRWNTSWMISVTDGA